MTLSVKVTLGEIATFIRGITFKPEDVVPVGTENSVACMRTKNVQAQLSLEDVWAVDERLVRRSEKFLQSGDILISSANSWNLVGKCSWVPDLPWKASFGGFVTVLRANPEKVYPRFLFWWFSSNHIQALARSFGNKTTSISNLNIDRCLSLQLELPPLNEQKRISEILDRAAVMRGQRKKSIDEVESLSQSVFFEMFGNPSDIAFAWPILKVAEAGRVQLGRQRAPKYQTGEFTTPYLRVANVFEDKIDLSDVLSMDFDARDYDLYRLHYGDILLNEGQSTELVGRPAMWKGDLPSCCFQNTLIRFQADIKKVIPEFALAVFLFYYRSGELAKISSKTSSVAHLGSARFSAMNFPVPPMSLQESFRDRIRAINEIKSDYLASLALLDTLFASLQHRAFRGEL
jgi:type I restriction enzyme S subunit